MINLDAAEEPQPRLRSRFKIYVAAAVAVLLLAGGATAYLVYRNSGTQIRFEATTASGTALQISWNIGIKYVGVARKPSEPLVKMPWSTTVTADDYREQGATTLFVNSTPTDQVTCRIFVEDEVVAELTNTRGAGCVLNLDRAGEPNPSEGSAG